MLQKGYNQGSREQSRPPLGGGVLSKPLGHVCRLLAGPPTRENVRHAPRAFCFSKMKTCRTCGIEKPLDSFHFRRDTGKHRNDCKACCLVKTQQWVEKNPEKRRAVALKWAKANYAYIRKKKAEYRAKDPLRMRRWAIENPEKMQACRDRWDAANKDRKAEHAAARRGRLMQAMPAWANRFYIAEAYRLAKLRTEVTGTRWEVDHIVPLAGKTVCGLHVEHNLQVIPMSTNRRKSRSYWPDMP